MPEAPCIVSNQGCTVSKFGAAPCIVSKQGCSTVHRVEKLLVNRFFLVLM
jgi:hypothetical protein